MAAPHLEALNLATGETVNFSSREDDHAILIYKLEPTTGMLRTRAYIGQHMPLYCSAMGKIYMAFGHPDYVEHYWNTHQDIIQPLTRNTITGLPAMHDELAQIRERNMAMDREENELGVSWSGGAGFRYSPARALRHFYFSVDVAPQADRRKELVKATA